MQIARAVVIASAALLGGSYLAGCASPGSNPQSRTAGQAVDDAAITARVKAALAREAGVGKAMDVNVTTNRGVVQLSGFVDSRDVADRAASVARGVDGVQSVRNDIQIAGRPGASTGAGSR
jgi:hyperosmotically inducible periplasmic protein